MKSVFSTEKQVVQRVQKTLFSVNSSVLCFPSVRLTDLTTTEVTYYYGLRPLQATTAKPICERKIL